MKKEINNSPKTLFFKIETVSQSANYTLLSDNMKNFWNLKCLNPISKVTKSIEEEYECKAALSAEFGKIICISVGSYFNRHGSMVFRTKSFYGFSEKHLLQEFSNLLEKYYHDTSKIHFVGHNIRDFIIPFICRRMIVNGIKIPKTLDALGKKPWETKYILDTLQLWKFGEFKHSISIALISQVLDINIPHSYIDGSMIGEYFWKRGDIEKIRKSSESKLELVSKIYRKITGADIRDRKFVHLQKVS